MHSGQGPGAKKIRSIKKFLLNFNMPSYTKDNQRKQLVFPKSDSIHYNPKSYNTPPVIVKTRQKGSHSAEQGERHNVRDWPDPIEIPKDMFENNHPTSPR